METFWKRQTRVDGRLLTQTRPTSIQTDIYANSSNSNIAGSALVHLGDTHVLAAVSLLIGQCTSSKAAAVAAATSSRSTDQSSSSVGARGGDIVVLVSSPDSSGAENRDGQAACLLCQSLLQRILHETIDLEQLLIDTSCIVRRPNKKNPSSSSSKTTTYTGPILAWRLQVTVRVLHNHGNIFDAALLASVAALQQTRLPVHLQYDEDGKVAVVAWTANANNNNNNNSSSTNSGRLLKMPLLPSPLSMGTFQISKNKYDDNDKDDDHNNTTTTTTTMTTTTTRWIVDPTRAEQEVLQNALCVVVNARPPHEVLAVEFATTAAAGGGAGISTTDLGVAIHMATARAQEVQALFQI
jgi:exosome complex RNA-binding protein Rrp42 (RNase PH superfamily)